MIAGSSTSLGTCLKAFRITNYRKRKIKCQVGERNGE